MTTAPGLALSTKRCSMHATEFPQEDALRGIEDFQNSTRTPDGLQSMCRRCKAVSDSRHKGRRTAVANMPAKQLDPEVWGIYKTPFDGKKKPGNFVNARWERAARIVGRSPESISEQLKEIWRIAKAGGLAPSEDYRIHVTVDFAEDFANRHKRDRVDPSTMQRTSVPQRAPRQKKNPEDRKPSPLEQAWVLEVEQKGFDFCGVQAGTWHRTKDTLTKTEFVIGHKKNRCEYADGRDHFFDNGERNFRMIASFVNDFENSYPWSPTRDVDTQQRLTESGIEHNIDESVICTLLGITKQVVFFPGTVLKIDETLR